ncbi:MAG: conjugal transfer protein TraB, partial [Caedimonadaceae bacterium]
PLEAKKRSKILHKKRENTQKLYKNASHYVPAGSYAKAVLTSGVVVSTSVATQSNPQPIILRLADEGILPRGFFSHLKDAVLIGSCYGDLSAERALCRLHTLSFIERDGTTVERPVEGWIIGEDGAPGLRGKIVDRAGEVAREAFLSGILSGMSSFLQFDASRSVYPVTPFGQTNALSPKDALAGGLGKGAGNALDKLAEFSIKRAEAMQPVIVVNGGRVVDVVFKRGIDLLPDIVPQVKLVSDTSSSTPTHSEDHL